MDKEVKELIALEKDSIVKLALQSVNSRSRRTNEKVSRKNFKKIKVFSNGKQIYVSFFNPIKYIPQNTVFYCDISVSLIGGVISMSPISNPESYGGATPSYNIPYYKETKEAKKNIQFIFDAINQSNEIGSVGDRPGFEDNMTIWEHKDYYDIIVGSKFQVSSYKIEKVSGKIYDTGHEHLIPDPYEDEDKNEFIEIKWN